MAADLDHDPEALEWARGKVLEVTGRWRANAQRDADTDLAELADRWRRMAVTAENYLIGGKTDVLGAFDARHAGPVPPAGS